MVCIKKVEKDIIKKCARIYRNAYREEPWNEEYDAGDVESYITDFLNSETKCAFAFILGEDIIGVAMGLIIPSIGSCYFRIEDICIDPAYQGRGYGRQFIESLENNLKIKGCDSILLGTQRGFPAHKFYLKNEFKEIDSVLLYREIKR